MEKARIDNPKFFAIIVNSNNIIIRICDLGKQQNAASVNTTTLDIIKSEIPLSLQVICLFKRSSFKIRRYP